MELTGQGEQRLLSTYNTVNSAGDSIPAKSCQSNCCAVGWIETRVAILCIARNGGGVVSRQRGLWYRANGPHLSAKHSK